MTTVKKTPGENAQVVTLALKRAANEARRIDKIYSIKVWYMRDGKLVGEKP